MLGPVLAQVPDHQRLVSALGCLGLRARVPVLDLQILGMARGPVQVQVLVLVLVQRLVQRLVLA